MGSKDSPLDDQGLPAGYNFRPQWERTPRQVKAMLEAGDGVLLLDCRTPKEHETARIADALLLPLQKIHEAAEELEDQRDRPIVVYCHHGVRSLRMTLALREMGFEGVVSMAGGIDLWSRDVDPDVPRY